MAVAILFHKFNVLCLLAFSALLHCLSCFNSYPRMMLINVVGSVSVLRASYAVICTWLWYFLKVKCKKRKSHLVWKNLRYNANIFVHKVSPNEINQQMTLNFSFSSRFTSDRKKLKRGHNVVWFATKHYFFCSVMPGINARKRF